jgi:hypothetical protein
LLDDVSTSKIPENSANLIHNSTFLGVLEDCFGDYVTHISKLVPKNSDFDPKSCQHLIEKLSECRLAGGVAVNLECSIFICPGL